MKKLLAKLRKHKASKQQVDVKVSAVRFELRKKFLDLQKEQLREKIVSQLASLRDEVNVEAILVDLGEKYILRPDFDHVSLSTNYNQDPVLVLRYTQESTSNKEQTDRFVPLAKYSV